MNLFPSKLNFKLHTVVDTSLVCGSMELKIPATKQNWEVMLIILLYKGEGDSNFFSL